MLLPARIAAGSRRPQVSAAPAAVPGVAGGFVYVSEQARAAHQKSQGRALPIGAHQLKVQPGVCERLKQPVIYPRNPQDFDPYHAFESLEELLSSKCVIKVNGWRCSSCADLLHSTMISAHALLCVRGATDAAQLDKADAHKLLAQYYARHQLRHAHRPAVVRKTYDILVDVCKVPDLGPPPAQPAAVADLDESTSDAEDDDLPIDEGRVGVRVRALFSGLSSGLATPL